MQAQHRGSARDLCSPVSNANPLAAGNLNTIIPKPSQELAMHLHMGNFYTLSTTYGCSTQLLSSETKFRTSVAHILTKRWGTTIYRPDRRRGG
eukprot:755550-Pelagomonas_calceolata.AAC.1